MLIILYYLKLNSGFGKYMMGHHTPFLLLTLNVSYLWDFHCFLQIGISSTVSVYVHTHTHVCVCVCINNIEIQRKSVIIP